MLAAVCFTLVIGADASAHGSFLLRASSSRDIPTSSTPPAADLPANATTPPAADPWALGARHACLRNATFSTCISALEGIRHAAWPHIVEEATGLQDKRLRDLRLLEPLQPRSAFGGGLRAALPQCSGSGPPAPEEGGKAANASGAEKTVVFYRHLFKSGGTSIMQNLQALSAGDCDHSGKWQQDGFCDELVRNLGPARGPNPPLLFTFVRDPIARLISGYSEVETECHNAFKSEYEQGTADRAVDFIAQLMAGWFNLHTASQAEFVLGHLRGCPVPFDYVGVLENFDSDWDELAERLHCEGGHLPFNRSVGMRMSSWDSLGTSQAMRETIKPEQESKAAAPVSSLVAQAGASSAKAASTSAMRVALRQDGGALLRIMCWFLLPDYIVFDYPLPPDCQSLRPSS